MEAGKKNKYGNLLMTPINTCKWFIARNAKTTIVSSFAKVIWKTREER